MRIQDIHLKDDMTRADFVSAFSEAEYDYALSLLGDEELDGKYLSAKFLNAVSAKLTELQNKYQTDVTDVLNKDATDFQTYINNFKYLGAYKPGVTYACGNMVKYNNNVYLYNSPDTYTPTSASPPYQFLLISGARGQAGKDHITGTLKFDWDSTAAYSVSDIVYHNSAMWYCKVANTNSEPAVDNTNWTKMYDTITTDQIIQVYTAEPQYKYNQQSWIVTGAVLTWQ